MNKIKIAVIGVGYLGKFHAQKYAQLPAAELIAVVDSDAETAHAVAQQYQTEALKNYHDVLGKVDAVSIAVPTQAHYAVAKTVLEKHTHVLLEKPMTVTVEEARDLVDIAASNNLVLQIGHLERFNPAILALEDIIRQPLFIESHRVAPFNPRGADVNVVLDLMIHDIDIILNFVDSPVDHIDANGVPILSKDIDIANVRIRFANACVANVTASRVGLKTERKMRLFQHDAYISIDFQNKKLGVHRKGEGEMYPGIPNIDSHEQTFEQGDALQTEITAFLEAIEKNSTPIVSGEDGLRALETASTIIKLLNQC